MTTVNLVQITAHLPGGVSVTAGPELKDMTGATAWEATYSVKTELRTTDALYGSESSAIGRGATRTAAVRSAKAAARRILVP